MPQLCEKEEKCSEKYSELLSCLPHTSYKLRKNYVIAKKVFYFELFTAAASRFLVPECLMVLKSNNCMRYGIQRIVGAVWLGEISASSLVRKS